MKLELLSFIIGIIAFTFYIFSVQKKDKNKLLKFQIVANIFYALQYFLLSVYSAAFMNIVSVIRLNTFSIFDSKKKKVPAIYLFVFIILIVAIGVFSTNIKEYTFLNILIATIPIIITCLYTLTTWKNNMKVIRYTFTICAILWIFYNFHVKAYASLIGNIFELISGILSIIRFRKN